MRVPRHCAIWCVRAKQRSSEAGSVASSSSAEQIPAALGSASADRNQAVDASLSDLGCAVTLHTDGSGGDAARLSARSRAHARTGGATGTSHHGGGQAGLARVTASHQRSTSPARYRGYLGGDHRGRAGPGVPLRRCSATDGILRCCAQRGFQRQADPAREHHQNGQRAFETNRRRSGMELSSPTCIWYGLRKRQESISEEVKEIAWKAQHRLHKRYMRLAAAGKDKRKITTAVARELLGFIWAIGIRAETTLSQRIAA